MADPATRGATTSAWPTWPRPVRGKKRFAKHAIGYLTLTCLGGALLFLTNLEINR
ncbi:hypothetical protein [Streptomyces sp. CC53]|uniref:hypothetical protein n=1 Tax=Streptomyces sp. CC53 TaxID=1906740 RepID=UPI0015A6AB55|nr:hypothetical protein [Streptomyces sp. CC53]